MPEKSFIRGFQVAIVPSLILWGILIWACRIIATLFFQ